MAITDVNSGAPKYGIEIVAMDYQQNLISQGRTNDQGMVQLEVDRRPYFVVAKEGRDHNYLRLDDGQSLSTSHFDTSGQRLQKGIKGFIYGERGVWRPGDKIYLTFVLFDSAQQLPKNHPVHFQLTNSRGQVMSDHPQKRRGRFLQHCHRNRTECSYGQLHRDLLCGRHPIYESVEN